MHHYVYIMRDNTHRGEYKIGYTYNLDQRLRTGKTWRDVEFEFVQEFPNKETATRMEATAQGMFADQQLIPVNEFYKLSKRDLSRLKTFLQTGVDTKEILPAWLGGQLEIKLIEA